MNSSIIRKEEDGVEYFTVVETGESAVSERGLSKMSGVPRKTLAGWLNSLGENKAPKGLETLRGKALYLGENIKKNNRTIKAIRAEVASKIIRHAEKLGNTEATTTLDAIAEIGLTSYIQVKTQWLPEQYQSSLEARETLN